MKKTDLLKEVQVEGLKLTVAQKEEFITSLEEAIKKFVGEGEKVALGGLGTFIKKERKGRERKEERVMTIGKGTDKERTITIPAGITPDKSILGFKTKVEF